MELGYTNVKAIRGGLDAWEKGETKMNVKCDPEWSEELRAEYDAVNPGWHMNKKHWNTVTLNADVPDKLDNNAH